MSIRNVINKQISAQTNGLLTRGQYGGTVIPQQQNRTNANFLTNTDIDPTMAANTIAVTLSLDQANNLVNQPSFQLHLPEGLDASPAVGCRQEITLTFPSVMDGFTWPFGNQDYCETNLSSDGDSNSLSLVSPIGVVEARLQVPTNDSTGGVIRIKRINIPSDNTQEVPMFALQRAILEVSIRKLNVTLITGETTLTASTDDVLSA
jgi:hypothetical protein